MVFVTGNADDISSNADSASDNADHISTLNTEAEINVDDISSNAASITSNADDTEDNADAIADNADELSILKVMPNITAMKVNIRFIYSKQIISLVKLSSAITSHFHFEIKLFWF